MLISDRWFQNFVSSCSCVQNQQAEFHHFTKGKICGKLVIYFTPIFEICRSVG